MKKVKVEKAVNLRLGADVTKIEKGKFKGPLFKRGHVIQKEDIEALKAAGKEYIWVYEENGEFIHQNEASLRMAHSLIGENLSVLGPSEGWAFIVAKENGIFSGNKKAIERINSFNKAILVTVEPFSFVSKNQTVAKCKITSLKIKEGYLEKIENIGKELKNEDDSVLKLIVPLIRKFAVIVTGTEIYNGLIKDASTDIIREKVKVFGGSIVFNEIVPDNKEKIKESIKKALENQAEMIIITGGMGPDPDDVTKLGLKEAGGKILKYGVPVNPATMSLIASIGNVPALGISAGFIMFKNSFLDFILPRILSGEKITRREIAKWGFGGMLKQCS